MHTPTYSIPVDGSTETRGLLPRLVSGLVACPLGRLPPSPACRSRLRFGVPCSGRSRLLPRRTPPLPLIRGQGSVGQTTQEPAESPVRAPVGGLWLTNVVLLLGVEVNAQFEHARAIADGFRKTCVLLPNRATPASSTRANAKLSRKLRRPAAPERRRRQLYGVAPPGSVAIERCSATVNHLS